MNTYPSKIVEWAYAAASYEVFSRTLPSGHNKNPGNFKFNLFVEKTLGATGANGVWAVFPSYTAGFDALCSFLQMACENELLGYHRSTILSFYQVYAPSSDNNTPEAYAQFIAESLGVPVETPIASFLTQ